MIKRFWQIHAWCGRLSGGFLAFILFTGALAVFCEPLYRLETRHLAHAGESPLDLSQIPGMLDHAFADASAGEGKPALIGIMMPDHARDTVQLMYFNQQKRDLFGINQPWLIHSYFYHPTTGENLGYYDDSKSVAQYLRALHVRIFASTPGRNLVGLFGLAMLVTLCGGLVILAKFMAGKALWVIRNKNLRLASADVHKLVGFVLLIPALLFAISGFWLGMQGHLMSGFKIERPGEFKREAILTPEADTAMRIDAARVMEESLEAYPELIVQVIRPSQDGSRTIEIRGKTPGMYYERLSQSVYLDKEAYSVLSVHNTHTASWQDKLFYLQEGLHFGQFWGAWSQVLYLIMGLLIAVLPITGYVIHYIRTKRSLRLLIAWTAFAAGYSCLLLLAVRLQGLAFANAYGIVFLGLFIIGLMIAKGVRLFLHYKQRRASDIEAPRPA